MSDETALLALLKERIEELKAENVELLNQLKIQGTQWAKLAAEQADKIKDLRDEVADLRAYTGQRGTLSSE